MEIRELAERVLFSADLADKLDLPDRVTDARPGAPISLPAGPHRPPGLGLHEIRGRAPFPIRVDRDADRAAVLHAFANHELLALELMALVLLRFPDAPTAFRRGLAAILAEEATHFRLYGARCASLGLEFGALPVNRFLWDSVAGVSSVEDYTARMSLTFEAANLDHALLWEDRFRVAGDGETAAVLDRVYADELGHVRHGLHWFRRALPAEVDLWAAYTAALPLPLTPARAKGEVFAPEARRAAGFDEAFIAAVALYQHSKGRPPVVHLFNPDAESQVAGARPSAPGAVLAEDLDLLPIYLAASDDVVVARRVPDPDFLRGLVDAGLALPQIEVCADLADLGRSSLAQRKLGGLDPWGWSPTSAAWLAPLRAQLVPWPGAGAPDWNPAWRPLYGKPWAAARLGELLAAMPGEAALAGPVGLPVADLPALLKVQAEFAEAGFAEVVVKAPFGTAGRGAVRLRGPPTESQARALARIWVTEGSTVVEPWLDRVLDLSFHLDVLPGGEVRYRGVHRFFTSATGRYLGSWLGGFFADLGSEIARFLSSDGRESRMLDRIGRATARHVGEAAAALGFVGPMGIDALVHRAPNGLRLRPVVEVNPRVTMGRLAMALAKRLAPRTAGIWAVISAGDLRRTETPELASWAASRPPAVWDVDHRLRGGVLFTTDPRAARMFTSAMSAGPDLSACWAGLGLARPSS